MALVVIYDTLTETRADELGTLRLEIAIDPGAILGCIPQALRRHRRFPEREINHLGGVAGLDDPSLDFLLGLRAEIARPCSRRLLPRSGRACRYTESQQSKEQDMKGSMHGPFDPAG